MFSFLKVKPKNDTVSELNTIYAKLLEIYKEDTISSERKLELENEISKNGYLQLPYSEALKQLTDEETLYALKVKWIQNGTFKDNKFCFNEQSVLARNNVKNSDWIKREGHNIKLINLAALGDKKGQAGKFTDWLKQLLILPTGSPDNNIFNTTIYLIPFHPREFGCAYLPKSSEISEELLDKNLQEKTGMNAKDQVKLFIQLAQLAGHPVIYDILPQTGRFAKAVLANPYIARWYDITALQKQINEKSEFVAKDLSNNYDNEDIEVVRDIYLSGNSSGELSEYYQNLFNEFENKMFDYKKEASNNMMLKGNQIILQKRVTKIVQNILKISGNKKITENEITNQLDIIKSLISEGLWPAPGGAWCSSGVPVYDKMSDCGGYPTFKHFDYKGEDVTYYANLDCQTPYYFVCLENGQYNKDVINYFVDYMINLQQEYNFDGFRVDHIDHIVDAVSENDGVPISYRCPRIVLKKLNDTLKSKIPYFATLAEYMLWDNFYKEYHEDMNFDLLWGNDIVSQFTKNPEQIIADNQYLTNYNTTCEQSNYLSILKTYNNQDGEFSCINQYPGQLGENGALFKYFKYKFLPGGKFAQRPVLYVDGDESFTTCGIERTIGEEVSMERNNNISFYNKFNAIDKFVKQNMIITCGEAQIIIQEEDGFVSWLVTKEPLKTAYLVVANYKYPTENICPNEDKWVSGESVFNKKITLPCDYTVKYELVLQKNDFIKQEYEGNELFFEEIKNSEFRLFELEKV